ncbi:unnamed protein product, partial [Polarella glacialis]
ATLAAKLKAWRFPSRQAPVDKTPAAKDAASAASPSSPSRIPTKPKAQASAAIDYSKWSNLADSDDDEVPRERRVAAATAREEDVGVKDLMDSAASSAKPLPVPDFLAGNTGGGGGTNCFLSLCKLLDSESEKGESDNAHQLAQVFGKMFHTGIMDRRRQDFYKNSLASLPEDAFVVVLGLGSVLPMLRAARRGSGKGAVLEMSAKLGKVAEDILQANKLSFPVAVVKGSLDNEGLVEESLRRLVPKGVKNVVILSERMAHDLLSSGIVPSSVAAHRAARSSCPGAKVSHLPRTVELFAAPVEIRSEQLAGFDIRPFNAFRHTTSNDKADFWWWPVRLDNQSNTKTALLGSAKTLCGFDFDRSTEIALDEVRRPVTLEASSRGRCNGVALWWTARFGEEEYSTRPRLADNGVGEAQAGPLCRSEWKQAVHYLAGETALFPGDKLELLVSITPRFTVRMMQQSQFTVEAPTWIQAPTSAKFSASMPVLPYHFLMMTDMERIEVYARGIRAAVRSQAAKLGRRPRVLDAGCGIGLLGMTAALEGAEVWLCEAVPQMRRMCRDVIGANAAAIAEKRGLVQLLPPMMSTRIQIGEHVKEKFDIVVSEVMDLWCLGEGVIPTMRHAHKKLLNDGGVMLPSKLAIFVQPLEMFVWSQAERDHKANLSMLGEHMKSKFSPMRIDQMPRRWLTEEPIAALEIDLRDVPSQPADGEPNMDGGVKLCIRMGGKPALHAKISTATIEHSGMLCGYGIWWAADLGTGSVVSSAPSNPQRSWKQLVRWLDQPRFVAEGEEIQVLACFNDQQVNVEDIHVPREMAEQYQEELKSAVGKKVAQSATQGASGSSLASPQAAAEDILEVD